MHDTNSLEVLSSAALTEEANSKAYKLALEMYILGATPQTISSAMHTHVNVINRWVMDYKWKDLKANSVNSGIDILADIAPVELAKKAVSGLSKVIYKAVRDYDIAYNEGTLTLSPRDLDRLATVLTNLDKVVRLEQGKPTDIHSIQAISYEEARKILRDDPFAKSIIDGQCREV